MTFEANITSVCKLKQTTFIGKKLFCQNEHRIFKENHHIQIIIAAWTFSAVHKVLVSMATHRKQ